MKCNRGDQSGHRHNDCTAAITLNPNPNSISIPGHRHRRALLVHQPLHGPYQRRTHLLLPVDSSTDINVCRVQFRKVRTFGQGKRIVRGQMKVVTVG